MKVFMKIKNQMTIQIYIIINIRKIKKLNLKILVIIITIQ